MVLVEVTVLETEERKRQLIQLLGFFDSVVTARGTKYLLDSQVFVSYQLLFENGFHVSSNPIKVYRIGDSVFSYFVTEALEAINRGDFVVKDFLNAVDGV